MNMRAKFKLSKIERHEFQNGVQEVLQFYAVCKNEGYGDDGLDENNTFAKFTPCADLRMTVNNPALVGKYTEGQEFYVDFTPV